MKMKYSWAMAVMALPFVLVSCSEDNNDDSTKATNYVKLSAEGGLELTEDDSDTIKINMLLSHSVKTATTLHFDLENNADSVLRIVNPAVVLNNGEKTAVLKIVSNHKSRLDENRMMPVALKESSDANIKMWTDGAPLTLVVHPDSDMPQLTPAQKELIAGYQAKGLDLSRFLGRLDCKVRVVFPNDENGTFFEGNEVRTFTGRSVLTLSEYATAEKPVLKMISNPMGLNTFLYEIMRKETAENESWMAYPFAGPVLKAIDYQPEKETFQATLDSLVFDIANKSVHFLASRQNSYGDEISVVPFQYSFSAWDRMKKMADEGKTFQVEEGGKLVEYTLNEAIEAGTSLNPYMYMQYSDLAEDSWENEPSDWIKPQATYDEQAGTLTFTFPWDHSGSSGYTQIQVEYTLKNKK